MKERRAAIYIDEDGMTDTTFSDGAHGEGRYHDFYCGGCHDTFALTIYPGFGGFNRLHFFFPYGVSRNLVFFSIVNSSRTGHKSDAWRSRVSKNLTRRMWHQSIDPWPDAVMTGWLCLAVEASTLLGSYINRNNLSSQDLAECRPNRVT